jgi:catechol 2,3-dioxygenase
MGSDSSFALPSEAHPGRVALRVRSLARVVPFYREVVGLDGSREGNQVRLGAGGMVLLELLEAPDAPERRPEEAGLFHVAFRYPDRAALADCLARIETSEYELAGASDHNVSESLYLRDPAGNGVELYHDRPQEEWPRTDEGSIDIGTRPLDLDDLPALASTTDEERTGGNEPDLARDSDSDSDGLAAAPVPAETTIGHVHLEAIDLDRTEAFYTDGLGFGVQARYGDSATFLAAGEYHHHLAINTWNERSERPRGGEGLAWFGFVLPDSETLDLITDRLADRGHGIERQDDRAFVNDPDGTHLRLSTG